ncbi:MAG: glycosyltransferase, partial [Deltaproteobacteria bacterium]|nr:glycosyltransferase [Deltaproteobacteria bacterium]
QSGIKIRFVHNLVEDPFAPQQDLNNRFSLWEVYQAAELVTYPSLYEGFGNALLEAMYFKKPLLVNRYKIFKDDIEPKGFDLIKMDGHLTGKVLADIKVIISDKYRREKMVTKNYEIAREHYSYALLHNQFAFLISKLIPQSGPARQDHHHSAAGP